MRHTATYGYLMVNDRQLIGTYVAYEIEARGSWQDFATTSGVSRPTLYRIKDADPRVSDRILRQVERGFGLPFDTFKAMGEHQWDRLVELGVDEATVEWLRRQVGGAGGSDSLPPAQRVMTR